MSETILLHFSGPDHTGLTTELTGILADYGACVLDIGQAVVHETLALGLLIELPSGSDFAPLKSALMEKAQSLGLHVRFTPVSQEALDHWLSLQGKDRFLVTILGRSISTGAQFGAEVRENIEGLLVLHGRLMSRCSCWDDGTMQSSFSHSREVFSGAEGASMF